MFCTPAITKAYIGSHRGTTCTKNVTSSDMLGGFFTPGVSHHHRHSSITPQLHEPAPMSDPGPLEKCTSTIVRSPHAAALALADRGQEVLNVVTVAFLHRARCCCLLIPLAKVLADAFGQGSGSHLCPMLLITQPAALQASYLRSGRMHPFNPQSIAVHASVQPLAIAEAWP